MHNGHATDMQRTRNGNVPDRTDVKRTPNGSVSDNSYQKYQDYNFIRQTRVSST